nr:hypothetical protein [Tanacetum cinerariifolium]
MKIEEEEPEEEPVEEPEPLPGHGDQFDAVRIKKKTRSPRVLISIAKLGVE